MSKNTNSLVAYFDILGYQSFLNNNNSALEAAEQVFKLVKQAPKEAVQHWEESDLVKNDQEWKNTISSIKSLVFSDTIVVSCPISETGPSEPQAGLMAGVSTGIATKMFANGLPVRGAITFGSFIFDETCIAGKSIVDAYQLCQTLDLAGIAIAPKLTEYIDKNFVSKTDNIWDVNFPYYLFPLIDQSELKTRSIGWGDMNVPVDFTTEVRKAFWDWNKDIPLSVDIKVRNTAKMLDFFRMHGQKRKKD